ncbi:ABC transporter ATP-binding protein [Lactobacillus xylocopicola]|uniref:ABC transporter ATP-binding protein n=1 Tax=Lactobacillus xylocopicola TaxID=2976676 RepID=A0ABN6SI59_9LACO|nr:ABC transporter ATP-binding protein [Lactobacillus xylocopicola]BDR59795.1 ABC transporter ATP-binding protein [Lactobacillus xylocopicola]
MTNKSIIEMREVCKIYQSGNEQVYAANNLNLKITDGELVVIVGASGAGKTTLLNLLGGMDTVSSGEINVNGVMISNYSEKKLSLYRRNDVGFVFQFYNLISNLTTLENVEFSSSFAKNPLDPQKILQEIGLGKKFASFPTELSGGQQQRVAIARAIAKNPLLLLCDEPTGALDFKTSKEVLSLLANFNKTYQKTVIIITHNSVLAQMADKVVKIKDGKIANIAINKNKMPVEKLEW